MLKQVNKIEQAKVSTIPKQAFAQFYMRKIL